MVMQLPAANAIEGRIRSRNDAREAARRLNETGAATPPSGGQAGAPGPGPAPGPVQDKTKPVGPSAPTPAPQPPPWTEPTAPPQQTSGPTRKPRPAVGRDIGGSEAITESRSFAQVGGREAARRGFTGNIQSGRSLFNRPGQNVMRGRGGASAVDRDMIGRQRRGSSLTRSVGAPPGSALAEPSGGGGGLEELLNKLQLG